MARVVGAAVSWLNLQVFVRLLMSDGTVQVMPAKRPVITAKNSTLTLDVDLTNLGGGSGGGSANVPFSGNGSPSASTLAAGNYLAGPVPSLYVDMSAKNLWVCTIAGTNATSVWAQISGSSVSSSLQQFKFVADYGDYISGYSWDGTTLGTVPVPIWKPHKIRCSIGSETIEGVGWNYTYSPSIVAGTGQPYYTRTAVTSAGGGGIPAGTTEAQLVTPDYLSNDIIHAMPITVASGAPPVTMTSISVAAVNTSGTAQLNDVFVVYGGTAMSGNYATFKVTGVAAGNITAVQIVTPGLYSAPPSPLTGNPAVQTGGSGNSTGATFNVTMSTPLLDIDGREWAAT